MAEVAQAVRIRKKAKRLSCLQEARNAQALLGELPGEGESVRIITMTEFSAVGMLRYVTDRTPVKWLGVVTFRVGKRCLGYLSNMGSSGRIRRADFILGWLSQERRGENRELGDRLDEICECYGWRMRYARNHAKVVLFDTDAGRFVLETSSNLNDLPNWESFSFEKDDQLFDFYKQIFFPDKPEEEKKEADKQCPIPDSPLPSSRREGGSTSLRPKSQSVRPRR